MADYENECPPSKALVEEPTGETLKMLHDMDKKLTTICSDVKHMKSDAEEFKRRQEVNKNKIDETRDVLHKELLSMRKEIYGNDERLRKELSDKDTEQDKQARNFITWRVFMWVIGFVVAGLISAHTYAHFVENKIDNVVQKYHTEHLIKNDIDQEN